MATPALGSSRRVLLFAVSLPSFLQVLFGDWTQVFWQQKYKLTELLEKQLHQQVAVLCSCTNSSASNKKLVHYLSISGMSRMSFFENVGFDFDPRIFSEQFAVVLKWKCFSVKLFAKGKSFPQLVSAVLGAISVQAKCTVGRTCPFHRVLFSGCLLTAGWIVEI